MELKEADLSYVEDLHRYTVTKRQECLRLTLPRAPRSALPAPPRDAGLHEAQQLELKAALGAATQRFAAVTLHKEVTLITMTLQADEPLCGIHSGTEHTYASKFMRASLCEQASVWALEKRTELRLFCSNHQLMLC